MPNTKSAEQRVRNSARRHQQNQSTKNRLKSLEKRYLSLATGGKKEEATSALRILSGALDKAAKKGVIHANTASRRKSRLSVQLG